MKTIPALLLFVATVSPTPVDEPPFLEAWSSIRGDALAAHVKRLASDEFEGRAPGTAGEHKTLDYLQQAFRSAGAGPATEDGYLQPVPLARVTSRRAPDVVFETSDDAVDLKHRRHYVAGVARPLERVSIDGSPVVFAGHGIVAPEHEWNDYPERVDGATVILLHGEPGGDDPGFFQGTTLSLHGIRDTKYATAARNGAVAVVVVHTEESAGYPWSVLGDGGAGKSRSFLAEPTDEPQPDAVVHLSEPAARKLFAAADLDFDDAVAAAGRPGFRPIATSLAVDIDLASRVEKITSNNVVARIEGREDPHQCLVYTAHWDHVGRNDDVEPDPIFNGAVDNATGTAGLLELARAFASLDEAPRRSVYFLATTAEEQGLLGSEYYAAHPLCPLTDTVAVLNLDALFPFGAVDAMTVPRLGLSEVEDTLAIAAARVGRVLQDDPAPAAGAYYRSDHYPFAARGVPAVFAVGGPRIENLTEDSPIVARFMDYLSNGYHKPGDEYDAATWDMAGIEQDVRVFFETGWRIAEDRRVPNWNYDTEFRALRDGEIHGADRAP